MIFSPDFRLRGQYHPMPSNYEQMAAVFIPHRFNPEGRRIEF
jgi:hypothetical protein